METVQKRNAEFARSLGALKLSLPFSQRPSARLVVMTRVAAEMTSRVCDRGEEDGDAVVDPVFLSNGVTAVTHPVTCRKVGALAWDLAKITALNSARAASVLLVREGLDARREGRDGESTILVAL